MAATSSYKVDTNWYNDMGATDHITSDLDRLAVRDQYYGGDSVKVGNGAGLEILHTGRSLINTATRPLVLNHVHHVPEIAKDLISDHKLSHDNNVFFEFHPSYYFIKDRATRRLLLEGRCESGLYPLKPADIDHLKHALVMSVSKAQWHARLGHPSPQVFRSILRFHSLPSLNESSELVCNVCQVAKSHQLPYSSSNHVSTSPLELIFSDVWGLAPQSVGGYKYYISFIDDFSKFSWIYLLHDRSEAPRIFVQFKPMSRISLIGKSSVSNLIGVVNIKRFIIHFFRSLGIAHPVSCPHTHQQNGFAERKHRHIVETGLALLAHASIPMKFWDDAFLTATYLINHLPTRVIDNQTPLEHLFKTPPNYFLLKTFGCACWPHLRPYNTRKFAFRSKECVFIGYSSLHKGYKCLDMDSGRVYISRDVGSCLYFT